MAQKRGSKKSTDKAPEIPVGVKTGDRDALIISQNERIAALESELLSTREDLQARQEELEVQAEELEAHLEEMNVTNEELEKEVRVRQISEAALRRSEFILAKSQEMAHVGNWAWNVQTGEMKWSDESFRIFGYKPHDIRTGWEWLVSRVHADDRGLLAQLSAAVLVGKKKAVDVRAHMPDGSVRYVNVLADKVACDKAGVVSLVYGIFQDITERKRLEEALKEREMQLSARLNAILSPDDASDKAIAEIVDIPTLQETADSFHRMTGVPNAIIDLDGVVLVGSGWQDICTKFHRVHPEACKNCIESDIHLTGSVEEGRYALYKCKNGMWDAVTPIYVKGKHIANLFTGQFFFDDEVPDYDFFREQANRYGFDAVAYMTALRRVSRHSREKIEKVMEFYTRFASMVSQLSYGNVQLAQSLLKQKEIEKALQEEMEEVEAQAEELETQNEEISNNYEELQNISRQLHESEALLRSVTDTSPDAIFVKDRHCRIVLANPATLRVIGKQAERVIGKRDTEFYDDPAIGKAIVSNDLRIMASGRTEVIEEVAQTPDGYRTYLSTKTPLRNDRGEITGIMGIARDITERKRTEERLHKHAALIDLSPDGIIVRKFDGEITFWSKGAEAMYGWTREEAVGRQTHALFKTRFPKSLDEIVWELVHSGCWSGELVHRTMDGREITVQSWWLATFDGEGGIAEILESNVDITVRKQIEKALQEKMEEVEVQAEELESQNEELRANYDELNKATRSLEESEERFRTLADNIPNLAWMADARGWIFWYNRQWYDYTGTTLEEMQGWGWQKVHHPDYVGAVTEEWYTSIKQGRPYDNIFPLRGKDGNYRWFLTRVTPIRDETGTIQRWFGTNTDITERKQAEDALKLTQASVDNAAEMIAWFTPDGKVYYANDATCRTLGYSREELLNMTALDFSPGFTREQYERHWQEVRERKSFTLETVHRRKDGSEYPVEVLVNYVQFGGREFIYAYGRDITGRKRAEEALKEAKTQAELYLDLMGHDISNMHQIALSQLELAKEIMSVEGKLAGDDVEMIDTPIVTLQRSAHLIENVGKLQKLRAGEYRMEIVDIGKVLDEVVKELSAPDDGVSINYIPAQGHLVKANPLIKEAFANLLGNAIKHSNGTSTINVDLSYVSEGGSALHRIAIEDTGPGIPDEKKEEIFHRFKRGQTKARGTGLGLYIVKTLVENFNGRVRVEDRVPGDYTKGSKFIVYLPVAEDFHE